MLIDFLTNHESNIKLVVVFLLVIEYFYSVSKVQRKNLICEKYGKEYQKEVTFFSSLKTRSNFKAPELLFPFHLNYFNSLINK